MWVGADAVVSEGLTSSDAAIRLARDGPNELPDRDRQGIARAALSVVAEPMLLALLVAGALNMAVNDPVDGAMLLSTAVLVSIVAIVQRGRADRALDRLRALASPPARVVRDGAQVTIPSREVVVGDLLVLAEGSRVAADGMVVASAGLAIEEALLTGESLPVDKFPRSDGASRKGATSDGSVVRAGTLVVRGSGAAVVTACAGATELGRIGASVGSRSTPSHALQRDVRRAVGWMGIMAVAVAVAVAAAIWASRGDALRGALSGLAVAMSLIPEELPVVLTVFLALGAWRMAKSRVVVRVPQAIESLGAVTVLCADKTGTMTCNDMAVASVSAGLRELPQPGRGISRDGETGNVLDAARRATPDLSQDPMDAAIIRATGPSGRWAGGRTVVREYPLGGSLRVLGRAWRDQTGDVVLAAKGAPEDVAGLCRLGEDVREGLAALVDRHATQGQRIIAVATARLDGEPPEMLAAAPWEFVGTIGFEDPVRDTAKSGVAALRDAGVRTVMVTGDHLATASAVAAAVGIAGRVVTGPEIDALNDAGLDDVVREAGIVARVTPAQKVRLVEALQRNGEIVAMTGDGVNDAPALHAADVGVAFGSRGSDVAREAADLVVAGDDLGALAAGAHLGREIFVNLRRAATFIVAVHVPIAGIALLPALSASWPIVLLPTQVALLELVIDPACAVVLESERSSRESLRNAPRRAGDPLVSRRVVFDGLVRGGSVLVAAGSCYGWLVASDRSAEVVRTAVFVLLMAATLVLVATVGPRRDRRVGMSRQPVRLLTVATTSALAALLAVRPVRDALGFAALSLAEVALWALVGATAAGAAVVGAGRRATGIRRRSSRCLG